MAGEKSRSWARITLISGVILTALSFIPIAMISSPDATLNTTQGLIYMFSLPLAGIGLVLGFVLLLVGGTLALVGRFRR